MSLSGIQKIKLQREFLSILSDLQSDIKGIQKIKLQRRFIELLEILQGGKSKQSQADTELNELIAKYKAGGFNNEQPDQFRQIIQKVYEAGLAINEVSDGVIDWLDDNPDKVAA